jgi:hypothetical protein
MSAGFVLFIALAMSSNAQSNSPAAHIPTAVQTNVVATNALVVPDISKGTSDVVKLFRSGKKDNVLIFYANNSGLDFNLSPDDLIYLKGIGLSSSVITAMMESDKERHNKLVVRLDDGDRDVASATSTVGGNEPRETATRVAATQAAPPSDGAENQSAPAPIYPDYSAYPNYYETFDNSDGGSLVRRPTISIGIGVGVGFGDGFYRGGYGGHGGGHFGGRR